MIKVYSIEFPSILELKIYVSSHLLLFTLKV